MHDLTFHLLDGDLRFIAWRRDGYQSPTGPTVQPPYGRAEVTALVAKIDEGDLGGG